MIANSFIKNKIAYKNESITHWDGGRWCWKNHHSHNCQHQCK